MILIFPWISRCCQKYWTFQFRLKSVLKIVFCRAQADNIGNVMIMSLFSVVLQMGLGVLFYFTSNHYIHSLAEGFDFVFNINFIFCYICVCTSKTFVVHSLHNTEIGVQINRICISIKYLSQHKIDTKILERVRITACASAKLF